MAEFNHEEYKFFVDNNNIKNGQLSTQERLNKSVNVLKKEVDNLYNRAQIIRGKPGFEWKSFTPYVVGEIVWYNGVSYKALQENYNEIPAVNSYWSLTNRSEYTLDVDPSAYLNMNNTSPYSPTGQYNPATKKYVDDAIVTYSNTGNFLALDRETAYTPSGQYNPATKKYVDESILHLNLGNVIVGKSEDSNKLGGRDASLYFESHLALGYYGFGVDGDTNDWIRSTASGILPFDKNKGSSLGSTQWKFKEVHAVNYYGAYNAAAADIAEKYSSDVEYMPGTVVGIGGTEEVTLYQEGMPLAGVVSTEPGYMLNSELTGGVYIALKGRVPVRIIGKAKKGQYISATNNGLGIASDFKRDTTVGVCLKDGEHIVEIKI